MDDVALRRSFLRVPLHRKSARWLALADCIIANEIAGENPLAPVVMRDLSPLPRTGFKGAESPAWVEAQGLVLPSAPNQALVQSDGSLMARLAPGEFLILGAFAESPSPLMGEDLVTKLNQSWSIDTAGFCFQVPRRDSHAWIHLSGPKTPSLFAKICGVDLSPSAFPDLAIAQTSVARLSAIVIRDDRGAPEPQFHLLADSASAIYLWDCLEDAMAEFSGSIAGISSLLPA